MAVVPFLDGGFPQPSKSGVRTLAEDVFLGLFVAAALYIVFNEGAHNWQSLWTCTAYLVLGITLWRPRTAVVSEMALTATTGVLGEVGLASQAPRTSDQTTGANGPNRPVRMNSPELGPGLGRAHDLAHQPERLLDHCCRHIQVRAGPDPAIHHRKQHAALAQGRPS